MCQGVGGHLCVIVFFFNDTATTEIYTLSLHDALPICGGQDVEVGFGRTSDQEQPEVVPRHGTGAGGGATRSEEHTSELQSRQYLVCRLLLEKKKSQTLRAPPLACRVTPRMDTRTGVHP